MADKKINVAVIGNGQRGKHITKWLLKESKGNVNVVSVYDPDKEVSKETIKYWDQEKDIAICDSCEEAINFPGVDWVLIFSPNAYHKEGILAGFKAGKHVFSEKPLATSIEDCQEIYDAHQKSGLIFATGFVLRYANIYNRVKEILDSGILGRIIAVEANEKIRPAHGGYIMCNWRRHTSEAGPHILEKCCHDLDLLLWFINSLPSKVAAFGGRDFFTPANSGLMEKYGAQTFKCWPDPHAIESPFSGDTDLMDNSVSAVEFRNGVRLTFIATMSNLLPERRMAFTCTNGSLIVDLYQCTITYSTFGSEEITQLKIDGDGHGGGDSIMARTLYEDTMCTGKPSKCSGSEGLQSAVFALAMDLAARKGEIVDLEPVWQSLGR